MKDKAHLLVAPEPGGGWVVKSTTGHLPRVVYRSKVDAVVAARNAASPDEDVIVQTSAGQMLSPLSVETTRDKASMREAVLEAVRAINKQKGADSHE